jgi:hypothetical protein
MTATPNFASGAAAGVAEIGALAASAASTGPYVLNLCSSTSPMALAQTELPELKRFTFFVSRRFEEGRERFRLHMGYFATLAEAEEWLNLVREIYPGAWAGEAPGRKLRERAAAANAAQAQHAAGPQPRAAVVARAPTPPPPVQVPVVHAAPPIARPAVRTAAPPVVSPPVLKGRPAAPPAARPAPFPAPTPAARQAPAQSTAPAASPQVPVTARPAPRAPAPAAPVVRTAVTAAPRTAPAVRSTAPPLRAAPPARAPSPAPQPPAATPAQQMLATTGRTSPTGPSAVRMNSKGVFEDSNVREVLKALGDASATGETRQMRVPGSPRQLPRQAAPAPAAGAGPLSDTQVLKMLEVRRPEGSEPAPAELEHGGIPLLKPDDTGTRLALKDAVANNAAVAFAVQLQWSVQPVELDKVPPLAIFSAYTLYTVEGSRDGRRWYGLRLGFFSDAISAKQVAHYVRSEFASVAVVPVSPQEKGRATHQDMAAALSGPAPARSGPTDEFKLIDDDASSAAPAKAADKPAPKPPAKAAAGPTLRPPPGKPRPRPPAKVAAREQRGPHSLEETLEILGASELTIDSGTGETLNESGVRHLRVEVQKNSPFTTLLERLSERLKKP